MSELATTLAAVLLQGWLAALPLAALSCVLHALRPVPARSRQLAALAGVAATALAALSPLLPVAVPLPGLGWPPVELAGGAVRVEVDPGRAVVPWLGLAWPAVACLLLAREGIGHARLLRSRRHWRPVAPEVRRALAWPDRVPLLTGGGEAPSSPMTAGLLRPAVFLPERALRALSPAALRAVTDHELAHARWRDPGTAALARGIRILLWPILPLRLLERLAHREAEEAADAAAVAREAGVDRLGYARTLVEVARWGSAGSATPGALRMAGSSLGRRVRVLLQPVPGGSPGGRRRSRLLAAAALGGALLVLAATPRVQTSPPGPAAPAGAPVAGAARSAITVQLGDSRRIVHREVLVF